MDFATLQPALVSWVKTLTGVDVAVFENEPRPRFNRALATLSWVSDVGVGIEDARWVYDPAAVIPNPNLTATVVGMRTLSLQVSIETLDQIAGTNGPALVEKLRARARLPSSLAMLALANVGLIEVGATTKADYRVDGRWQSRALAEVRFNATTLETDTPTNTIETVAVTSHVTDANGVEIAPSIQMIAEVLP